MKFSSFLFTDKIVEIIKLIDNSAYELFNTEKLIRKIPMYAVDREAVFEKLKFTKSNEFLIGIYSYINYREKDRNI